MTKGDFASLPFDSERMLEGLRPWVECESPSWDQSAVNRMMDLAAADFASAGAHVERHPGTGGFGDYLRVSLWPKEPFAPGILVLGHFDTVHPIGTLERLPWRREGDTCFGPGILDMKAGNYLVLEVFRVMNAAGIIPQLPVTALFTSDEEVGSPTSREIIEAEAGKNRYVLVLEPARPDGSVVTGRHAIARIEIEAKGKPTHAGHSPRKGVSAIREMAEVIPKLENLSSDTATCSVGIVRGGEFSNCVASTCHAEALIMAHSNVALRNLWQAISGLLPTHTDAELIFRRGLERPLWESSGNQSALYKHAREIASNLGLDLQQTTSGGGSDGNFTGAAGIPTLDGLGARGAMLHTLEEHIVVSSLAERARLLAGLFSSLDFPPHFSSEKSSSNFMV